MLPREPKSDLTPLVRVPFKTFLYMVAKSRALNYIKENEKQAEMKEENTYVEEELLEADADGRVKDPLNPIKTLNATKIRVTYSDNRYEIKVLI